MKILHSPFVSYTCQFFLLSPPINFIGCFGFTFGISSKLIFTGFSFISFPFSFNYRNFRHLAAILFNRRFSDKIRLFSIRGETKRVSHCRLRNSEPFRKHRNHASGIQNSLSIHLFFVYNYYICYLLFRFRFESGLVIDYDANIRRFRLNTIRFQIKIR